MIPARFRKKPGEFIVRLVSNRMRKCGEGMRPLEFVLETGKDGKRARQRKAPPLKPWVSARRQRHEAARKVARAKQRAKRRVA